LDFNKAKKAGVKVQLEEYAMINRLLYGAATLTLVTGLAWAGPAMADEPRRGGTLVYGVKAEPETYDIHATNQYGVMHYLPQHYSTLLTFDWKHFPKLRGDLADSWNVSADGLIYTFKLHPGVKFHDGTPLTSADVVATFDRLRNPPKGEISARQALFGAIDRVEAPDALTVVFTLKEPDSSMLQGFGSPYNAIYSKADIDKPGNWHKDHVNGTGPFRFVEYVAGEKWVAKRYENYHHDDVYLDGTIAYKIKDVVNPMVGGQIMAEWRAVSAPERANLEKLMGDKVTFQEGPWLSEMMVTLNGRFEAFKDKRVRQALNLCIDRQSGLENLSKITILSSFQSGHVLAGTDFALSKEELQKIPGFGPDVVANRARAKQLLKESGHEGLAFIYSSRAVPHPYDQIAIYLISQWKACGLNPTMVSNPTAKFSQMRSKGGFDATIDWNTAFLTDPTLMINKHLSADRSPQNYAGYTDRELDRLYDAQRKELDPVKRKEYVNTFEKRALDEAWTLPVTYMARVIALNAKVKGYVTAPTHVLNTDWRGVWIDE
jgi:peptide/nickel transport system substrate-binding protein